MDNALEEIANSIRYGDKARAKTLLKQVLAENPSAQAYFYASQIEDTTDGMIKQLKKALELDPDFELAKKAIVALGEVPESTITSPPATQPPQTKQEPEDDRRASKPAPAPRKEGKHTVYQEGVYEMWWDCKACGTEKLLAKSQKFCPHCGAPQDPEWRYFPSDEEKVAVKDHSYSGADKVCPACGTLNDGAADYCARCGAPQNEAARVKQQQTRVGQSFATEDLDSRQIREFDAQTGRVSGVTAAAKARAQASGGGGFGIKQIGIIAAIVAVIGVIGFMLFATQESNAIVIDYRWEREIEVEQLSAIPGKAECGSEPNGAYDIDRRYEEVDSRRVQDGESCTNRQVDQGDGTFRQERVCEPTYRTEPIMGYVCYYTINQWQKERTSLAEGNKSIAPEWPVTNLQRTGNCVGCEREGTRTETYYLVFRADGDNQFECPVERNIWEDTALETPFKLQVARVGGRPDCRTLERAS